MVKTPKAVIDDIKDRGQAQLEDALVAGKRGTEQLTAIVRREVERQLRALGLRPQEPAKKKATAKKSGAKKSAAKKPVAKKATAKKSTTTKATAKKTTAKKPAAKKSTAQKPATKRAG